MTRRLTRCCTQACALSFAISLSLQASAQQSTESSVNDSTVIYPAEYFADYSPVSANDMIDRIPGAGRALNQRGGGSSRGLGSGEGEILINGQRITGKTMREVTN